MERSRIVQRSNVDLVVLTEALRAAALLLGDSLTLEEGWVVSMLLSSSSSESERTMTSSWLTSLLAMMGSWSSSRVPALRGMAAALSGFALSCFTHFSN